MDVRGMVYAVALPCLLLNAGALIFFWAFEHDFHFFGRIRARKASVDVELGKASRGRAFEIDIVIVGGGVAEPALAQDLDEAFRYRMRAAGYPS